MSHPGSTPAWPTKGAHRNPNQTGQRSFKSNPRRGRSTINAKAVESNEKGGCVESADEDEESKEDGDPEAFAPSEYASSIEGIQAGLRNRGINAHNAVNGKARTSDRKNVEDPSFHCSSSSEEALAIEFSTTVNSEDEDYNAIDFISESDEEEPGIELFEEQAIIESEEDYSSDSSTFAALSPIGPFEDWPDLDLPSESLLTNVSYGDAAWPRQSLEIDDTSFSNMLTGQDSSPSRVPSPHVHFGGDIRRSSSISESIISQIDRNIFPDVFMDRFDPKIKGLIENDDEAEEQSLANSESSQWDLENCANANTHSIVKGSRSVDKAESLSGYETDDGETTDEEIIPPATITRPQSLLSLNSSPRPPIVKPSAPTLAARKGVAVPASRRRGPTMGSWIADPTKPIVVIDSTGKHMVLYPAKQTAKTHKNRTNHDASGCSSTDTTPRASVASLSKTIVGSDTDRNDFSSQNFFGPMIGPNTNLMMTELFHGGPGSEHVLGGQVVGPPEAFYPWKSINANGDIENDALFDQDSYNMLDTTNYDEFIEYGSESESNADVINQDDAISPTTNTFSNVSSTPKTSSSAPMSTTQELLQHFDKGIVSAFRRDQSRLKTAMLDRHTPQLGNSFYGMKATYAPMHSPFGSVHKRKGSFGQEIGGCKRKKGSF